MEKIFCDFLSNIGIIDKETLTTFLQIYNDIFHDNKYINIYQLSFNILMAFLNNITNKQKIFLCENLPMKFFSFRKKLIKDKLRAVLIIIQLKYRIKLLKYFYTWKNYKRQKTNKSIKNNNKQNSFIYNRNSYVKNPNFHYQIRLQNNIFDKENKTPFSDENDIFSVSAKPVLWKKYFSNSNTTKNSYSHFNFNLENNRSYSGNKKALNKSYNNSKVIKDIKKTLEYKEEKELEECTFHPKINNLKQKFNTTKKSDKDFKNRFEQLYNYNEKYKLSKQIKALELDYLINKELTFNPLINNKKKLIKENSKENFETRIKSFLAQKKQHSDDLKNKINREFERNFSFTPKINSPKMSKTNSSNSIFSKTLNDKRELETYKELPAYLRLYEESKLRNQKQIQKRKEADDFINNLSNSNIKNNTILDYTKIYDLYEDKNRSKIEERTKEKVNKEEGITFKPNLYKNKFIKNIFSNFYERNSKFLEDKEKFINSHKYIMNKGKVISPKEKRQIVENVIGRLYSDPKSFSISASGCNRYIKNLKGNLNKNLNINDSNYQDN